MPKLAKTLERIRNDPEDFYNGELAKDIVQDIQDGGGIFTLDDLENYKVKFRRPMNGTLGNYSWYSTPPPGSGVVLSFILNILKGKLAICNNLWTLSRQREKDLFIQTAILEIYFLRAVFSKKKMMTLYCHLFSLVSFVLACL